MPTFVPWGTEGATEPRNTAAVDDVAHRLVRCLQAEGVEYVFGIPGEENTRFVDALNGSGIRYILVRHEQAASFMAEVYGRLTGRAGVCRPRWGPARSICCSVQQTPRPTVHRWWPWPPKGRCGVSTRSHTSHRPGIDVRSRHPVGGSHRVPGRRPGDDTQGVQDRAERASWCRVPGGAGGHRSGAFRRTAGPPPRCRQSRTWMTSSTGAWRR
jgi:hypothetical protein